MLIAIVPLFILIIGALVYLASTTNAKMAEMGRLAFFAGLLALVLTMAHMTWRLGG